MPRLLKVLLAVSVFCQFSSGLQAQQLPETIVLGERLSVRSEILQQDRRYLVYLPPSYSGEANADKSFPVIYLLDGGAHFNAATGALHHLSAPNSGVGRIAEMIVIGIPNMGRTHNMTPTNVTAGPYADDSGGAADFLRFLREELIPEIESRYRTSGERTLIGHSLAGLFALDVWLKEPTVFDHYIAIEPSLWWDDQLLVRQLEALPQRNYDKPVSVFIAQANSPESDYDDLALKQQHETGIRRFHELMEAQMNPMLHTGYEFFADETHVSVPLIAIYRGLLFSFPLKQ